jgi:hypothetical protein
MTIMELTFLNDLGQSFVVTVDPNMELENVMALLEAEVRLLSQNIIDPILIFMTVQYPSGGTEHLSQGQRSEQSESYHAGVWNRGKCDIATETESAGRGQVNTISKQ